MIQPCTSIDQPGWLAMREALWPGARDAHVREMASFLDEPSRYCQFVAYTTDGHPCGFVEASLRTDYVNGTSTSPVAFLEGLYVNPSSRRRGIARALVAAAQQWAERRGCRELASDALIDNAESHALHEALGFEETERVVYFRKPLEHGPDSAAGPQSPGHPDVAIRVAASSDTHAIAEIYNHYIRHTVVTFEEEPVDAAEMDRRMADVHTASLPWLVATDEREGGQQVVGYAYATRWRGRVGYRFSAEITVYLDPAYSGRGIGSLLYSDLFLRLDAREIHAVMGGIALPNDASIALHEKFGMRKTAHFAQVGFKFNRWIDVGFWQRILNVESGR